MFCILFPFIIFIFVAVQLGETRRIRAKSLAGVRASTWPLFAGDPISGHDCYTCAGVPIEKLKRKGDEWMGCNENLDVPVCPVNGVNDAQAGGHAGTFHKLHGGRIAKHTLAFEKPSKEHTERKIQDSRTEWEVFMEMWCLERLDKKLKTSGKRTKWLSRNVTRLVRNHPLRNFVLTSNAWAPTFHGVCQLEGNNDDTQVMRYLVMEDILSPFHKPCQLDLKLGYRTVEPGEVTVKWMRQTVGDLLSPTKSDGARLAGYKVWSPFENRWHKMSYKAFSPLLPLQNVFDRFTDWSGYTRSAQLVAMRERLLQISAWWSEEGKQLFNSVALSALMVRECDPRFDGSAIIKDIRVQSGDATVLSYPILSGGTFVTIHATPEGTVYPRVDGRYAERSESMGFSTFTYVTKTNWEAPEWMGKQFDLKYVSLANMKLVIQIWSVKNQTGKESDQKDILIGDAEVPFESGKNCVGLDIAADDGESAQFCLTIEKKAFSSKRPVPDPVIKLIDYAHFYEKSQTADWPEDDGVDMGLLAAVTQLSRKIHARSVNSSNGKNYSARTMKAATVSTSSARAAARKAAALATSTDWHVPMVDISDGDGKGKKCARMKDTMLERSVCERLAVQRGKKYISWREKRITWFPGSGTHVEGECRVCDKLDNQSSQPWNVARAISAGPWQVFKRGYFRDLD